jgi:hypothetical protein
MKPLIPVLLACAASLLAACARPGSGGPAAPATLAIPINLKCTTCDDFIRCAATGVVADPVTGRAPHTIYRLREKTFWAQIATIGDYLLQFFVARSTDARPYTVYVDDGSSVVTQDDATLRAQIDVNAQRIRIGERSVDQREGLWYDAQGAVIGQCAAMSRREGYARVRELRGQAGTDGASAWPEFKKPAECR